MTDEGRTTKNDGRHALFVLRRSSFVLPLAVFALAATVMLQRAATVGYNTDEGQHIATAEYFEIVFLQGRLGGPPWEETYWTLTQPPIPRYVLGAAIWLSGNPVPRLDPAHRIQEVRGPNRERYWDPATYTNERRLAEERRVERRRPAVLAAARVPMALFAAGAVLLLFLLGRALAGTIAGLVAALGLLWAPLGLTLLPRAHAEGPLLLFILLGLYLGVRGAAKLQVQGSKFKVQSGRDAPLELGTLNLQLGTLNWVGVGLATGLGAATKLTAVLGLAALGAFAAWSLAVRRWTPAPAAAGSWRWSALAVLVGLVTFVAVNPFLWPDPVGRTAAMLQFRRQELVGQRTLNAGDAVPEGVAARSVLLLERTFVSEAPLARRTGLPLDAGLALVGAAVLARRAYQARDDGGLVGPAAFALIWIATFLAGTAPNLGLDWQRYYLPTVALGLILVGVGAEVLLGGLLQAGAARTRRGAPRTSAAAPASATTSGESARSW